MGRIMQKYRLSSAAWSSCPVSTSYGAVVLYDSPGTVRMNARQFSNTYSMGYPSPSKLIR